MEEKNDVINVNVKKETKEKAMEIFKKYNLTMTEAITMYLKEIIKYNGIPFRIVKNPKKKNKFNNLLNDKN